LIETNGVLGRINEQAGLMCGALWLSAAMLAFAPSLQAQDLMDWLQDTDDMPYHASSPADVSGIYMAELVTLEPGESEMYPKVSPDGKYLLVVSGKSRKPVITRRLIENGDPINLVSESDPQVLDSIAWHGNDRVIFLSYRADSLGVWEKPAAGGVTRRYQRLDGELRSPVLLDDGNIIAVRLQTASKRLASPTHKATRPGFDNWDTRGKQSYMVRINRNGAEHELTAGANPALSPDGKRLVFCMQEERNWHLFMMNVDGSNLIQLTEGHHVDVQPTWSPDGKWIAFTSNRGKQAKRGNIEEDSLQSGKANWDVWLISHDGRGLTRLTQDNGRDGAPGIANNGRVYFHSDRKVNKENSRLHQVRGAVKGFHIWSVALPAKVS